MRAFILAAVVLASCSPPRPAWREPELPERIGVQLDVPPNAPGEGDDLAVGSYPVVLREPRLVANGGDVLLTVESDAGPLLFRLEAGRLAPLSRDRAGVAPTIAQQGSPWTRTLHVTSSDGRTARTLTVTSSDGRIVAAASPAVGARPAKLSVRVEGARSADVAPDLVAEGTCAPFPIAAAAAPVRVLWRDCVEEVTERRSIGPASLLRLSSLVEGAWSHDDAPRELLPPGASLDAFFSGDRLIVALVDSEGRGAVVTHDGNAWSSPLPVPETRIGRAGPPSLAADGERVVVAWQEPAARGSRILVREAIRGRWPLVGRGGVETALEHAGTRPAVGWTDGDIVMAGVEPGGLYAMRWDGHEWQRLGGRVAVGGEGAPVAHVAIGVAPGAVTLAWSSGGRVWLARRTSRDWDVERAPLGEHARAMAFSVVPGVAAVGWLDDGGHAFVRSGEPGSTVGSTVAIAGTFTALDLAAGVEGTLLALVPAGGAPRVALARGSAVEDLGGPAEPRGTAAVAVARTGSGGPVIAWPSAEGVALALRSGGVWSQVDCSAAHALGPGVDAIDLAIVPGRPSLARVAVRQVEASTRIRVIDCPLR